MNAPAIPMDTTPEAMRVYYDRLRNMEPIERWDMMFRLMAQHREWLATGVRSRHPEYSPAQVRMAVIRLTLGERLFREAYPDCDVKP
jgi:hypothetical protein